MGRKSVSTSKYTTHILHPKLLATPKAFPAFLLGIAHSPPPLTRQVIFVLYLGSWSDRTGRKVPLVISLLGLLGEAAVFLANALSPSWGVSMALLSSVPYSLSGGTHALLMLAFAHLADTSGRRE